MSVDEQQSAANCTSTFSDAQYSAGNSASTFIDSHYPNANGAPVFADTQHSQVNGAPTFVDAPFLFEVQYLAKIATKRGSTRPSFHPTKLAFALPRMSRCD